MYIHVLGYFCGTCMCKGIECRQIITGLHAHCFMTHITMSVMLLSRLYVTAHEKRDLPPHLVILCNKPKCSKNWSQVKIQITLVLWTTILCLPCGKVSTIMRALVCPGEAFTFHNWAVWSCHSLHTTEAWSRDVNCHYGNGNCSFTNIRKTILLKSFIKQSYRLEHMLLSLGWHWKGTKKRKKLETVVSTSSGHGHTSRDFMHKRSQVWYTEMLTRQWLPTIKRVFLCKMIRWWHTRTGMYLHNGTIAIAIAWTFYGCKKCKLRRKVLFLMRSHIYYSCIITSRHRNGHVTTGWPMYCKLPWHSNVPLLNTLIGKHIITSILKMY